MRGIAEGQDGDEIVIGGKSGSLGAYNLIDGAPVFSKDLGELISSLEQAGGGSDPGTGANIPEYLYVEAQMGASSNSTRLATSTGQTPCRAP